MISNLRIHRMNICFVLLSLVSICFVALLVPTRTWVRWTVFTADEPINFRYVVRVEFPLAQTFVSEEDRNVQVLHQEVVRTDGNIFLVVDGSCNPTLSQLSRVRLYTMDGQALAGRSTRAVSSVSFPALAEGYQYQYADEEAGYLLQTDGPVTLLPEASGAVLRVTSVTFLCFGVLAVFEALFLLSIFLTWRRMPYARPVVEQARALQEELPPELWQREHRAYNKAYGWINFLSLLFRFLALCLLSSVLLWRPWLWWSLAIACIALATLAPFICLLLRLRLILPAAKCQIQKVAAAACAAVGPDVACYFCIGYSARKYLGDFTVLSYLALALRLEGRPSQAVALLDLCYREAIHAFYRTNEAQYHSLRCQCLLDMEDYDSAAEEVVLLEQSLRRIGKVPRVERAIYRRMEQQRVLMLAMVEGRWEDARPLAAALRADSEDTPLGQVRACSLQYRVARATKDEALVQDCLTAIRRYRPDYADFLASC